MIAPADMQHCRDAIRHGSLSFHTASRLLPARVRDPALALYAFCRLADDAVDLHDDKTGAVLRLRDRLDLAYAGRPRNAPADRAFASVIDDFHMPRALPDALLEGLAWDALEHRYADISGLHDYSARVAAAVGAMMCVLMGVRDRHALARACDLGVAMQLTNIARDVGEDARARRIYLPTDWLDEARIDPDAFFADPLPTDAVRAMVRRLLDHADRLYFRAEAGVAALPLAARPGIFAARHIYAGIGTAVRRNGYDSVSWRGRTSKRQKVGWLGLSILRAGVSVSMPRSAVLYARPLPETAFLVDAAAQADRPETPWGEGRTGALIGVFAQLEQADRARSRA
ncbi:phytoene/squalene synthase family protein [Maribius pontilimi]|uniref:Phytoene/squalene synthase family protein n=1 Tax=Palleronia pontilimi TaxID=1964209 RepID=A0A934I9C4_9RHOB|nr:phytoene/squalene synthase family protein [Palleronia pontilimi]MBJ3761466.1 phytoene/squalene synthase family protein [Palleronia pontilimi]